MAGETSPRLGNEFSRQLVMGRTHAMADLRVVFADRLSRLSIELRARIVDVSSIFVTRLVSAYRDAIQPMRDNVMV